MRPQPRELGLTAGELAVVFPFHLGVDSELRITQLGPSLRKLVPRAELGQSLREHFAVETPQPGAFATLRESPDVLVKLRCLERQVVLRGQSIWYPREDALLILCSPWLTSTAELPRNGLTLADFAVHDPMADLLQVLQAQEATLADVRKLVSKLSAQRKEQRAAAARMQSLYEISRLLSSAVDLDEVAQQVLEQSIGIAHCPVATLWLLQPQLRAVAIAPGNDTPRSRELVRVLREAAPEVELGSWLPTEAPLARRLDAEAARGARALAASDAGLPLAYQVVVQDAGGTVLGAFEVYGVAPPVQERAVLETMSEVSLRLSQFLHRARADAALRASIHTAASAAAAKSQFLARMSHEIRTPINGVLGMIELVLGSELSARQRSQLEQARSSGEILLGLVNDVLDFSKIESGHLEIEQAPFELEACLWRAFQLFESRALAKKLLYELELEEGLPALVAGDSLRLSQVLVNLIGNAMKFTKVGAVLVRAAVLDESERELTLGLEVRDTGVGISEQRRQAIFAPFTQAELATAREYGGTGLGLAICKQLVELMGGELTVESEVGKGSVFRFFVRLGKVAKVAARAPVAVPVAERRALRVLVVEDNEINQVVARGLLEREHHVVEIADSMEQAIRCASGGSFDLILMDVQLPDGDGLTATAAIRAALRGEGRTQIPIIGLSAQAVAGDRERALAAGMDEYLTKPVRAVQLSEVLQRFGSRPRRATTMRVTRGSELRDNRVSQRFAVVAVEPVGAERSFDPRGFVAKVAEYGDIADVLFSTARDFALSIESKSRELEASASEDLARVGFLAHSLAGSAGTLGFCAVERAAREIERLARRGAGASLIGRELEVLRDEVASLQGAAEAVARFVAGAEFAALERQALTADVHPPMGAPA